MVEGGGGGGLLPLGIQRRGSEPKTTSCGVILINISIASESISFQKIALHFQILLYFQTTDILAHLF